MSSARLSLGALVSLVAAGCSTPRPPRTAHSSGRAEPVANATVDAGVAEPSLSIGRARWTGPCATVVSRMRAVITRLPSACASDAACVCYPGGVESVTACGGVSDTEAAAEVARLQAEFRQNRCDYGVNCAPRECRAACVQGRCAER
jgi:hypothetical protein